MIIVITPFFLGVQRQPDNYQTNASTDYSAEQQCENPKTFGQRLSCDPVAQFTLWLAVFTFVLAASTIGLWRVTGSTLDHARSDSKRQSDEMQWSLDIAKQTADAAITQARAATNAGRAFLTPGRQMPELKGFVDSIAYSNFMEPMEVRFGIENRGFGPAFLLGQATTHELRPRGSDTVTLTPALHTDVGRVMIGVGSEWTIDAAYDVWQFTQEEWEAFTACRLDLFVYGFLRYRDLLETVWDSGFIYVFSINRDDPEKSGFLMHPSTDWWFDRRVQQPKT